MCRFRVLIGLLFITTIVNVTLFWMLINRNNETIFINDADVEIETIKWAMLNDSEYMYIDIIIDE